MSNGPQWLWPSRWVEGRKGSFTQWRLEGTDAMIERSRYGGFDLFVGDEFIGEQDRLSEAMRACEAAWRSRQPVTINYQDKEISA